MYVFLVDVGHGAVPNENIPIELVPAADPYLLAALAAAADPFVSQAYVYLTRVDFMPAPQLEE